MTKKNVELLIETGDKKKTGRYIIIGAVVVAVVMVFIFMTGMIKIPGVKLSLFSSSGIAVENIGNPVQREAKGSEKKTIDGYNVEITYLYSYEAEALVVHTKNYSGSDLGSELSPKDAALAWGEVAALNDEIDFHWSQSGRWYYWKVNSQEEADKAGGVDYINSHSANTHLLPADDSVRKDVKKIRTGDHILLKGYLVSVYGEKDDGTTFTWSSSTSRNDTGDGACEVMYVTSVQWLK